MGLSMSYGVKTLELKSWACYSLWGSLEPFEPICSSISSSLKLKFIVTVPTSQGN